MLDWVSRASTNQAGEVYNRDFRYKTTYMYIHMKIYPHTTDNVIRLGLKHGYQDKVYYIEHAAMPRTGNCDVLDRATIF